MLKMPWLMKARVSEDYRKEENAGLRARLEELEEVFSRIQEENTALRSQLMGVGRECDELRIENDMLRAMRDESAMLRSQLPYNDNENELDDNGSARPLRVARKA